jgi:pilus assembly protein FimV
MVKKLVVLFTSVVLLAAAHVKALGLGEITIESALDQPLVARVELLQLGSVRPDQITVGLASQRDFDRFSIDRSVFLNDIQFNVEALGTDAYIRMTSQRAIKEPFVSLVLDTRWPSGRVLSEYTMLLDPPAFSVNESAPAIARPTLSAAAPVATTNSAPQRLAAAPSATIAPAASADTFEAAAQDDEPVQTPSAEPVNNEIVPLAANDDTVTVGTDDTLWDIALQVKPDTSVTVQQTMLALQRLNAEAFIADNINMIRRGQVLRIPDIAQISALSARDAVSEVSRQNQLFDNRRNVPLASQPLAAQPNAMADASANRGELSLVTDDSDDQSGAQSANGARSAELDARISGLEDALAVQQEETDRVNLRADELNERLRLLEEQIESVKEMVRLRDLELAQLQQSLAEAAQVAANEVAEAAVEEPIITMAPEKSFLQSLLATLMANTFALIGAVALLVLALVFVLLRRNKTKNAEALEDLDAMEPSIDGPADDASDEGAETQASEEALGEIFNLAEGLDEEMVDDSFGVPQEAAEGGDAVRELLEEADALISHERYEEAISLLQDGIVAEPNSSELRLKLLEVCVVKKDAVGFKLQETELRESASPAVLARIEELKAQLRAEVDDEILEDGDEEFFAEQESSEDVDDLELALDMEASADVDDEKVLSGVQDPEEEDESEEAAESEEPHFYSDNDGEGEEPSVLNSAADLEGDKEEADDIFDLSTDSDDDAIEFAVEEDVASAVETTEAAPSGENTEEDDANSIDFDISDLGQPEALVSTEQELESDNDIEFDFDLDDDLVTDSSVDESLDDSGSLEFDADAETAIEEVEAEPEDDEEFSVDFEDTSAGDSESVDAPVLEEKAQNKEPADDDIVFELDDEDSDSPATIRSAKEDLDIEFTGLDTDDEAGQVDSTELEPAPEAPEADDDTASEADDEFGDLQFLSDSDRKSGGDDDEDDMDFLSDTDEAATKLDLARAYFEMGDHDGAKEILDEVVKEGTQEQIEDAKALLGKL